MEYLTSPEVQADWTVNTGYIGATRSAWETETLQDLVDRSPEYATARDQLEYAAKELATHDGIAVRAIINAALDAVITSGADIQTTLDEAQAEADAVLEPYR